MYSRQSFCLGLQNTAHTYLNPFIHSSIPWTPTMGHVC